MAVKMTYSWIIYSCLIFGSGVLCDRKLEKRQAASSCSVNNDDEFNCSNGKCIDWSWVCDGYMDCSDGSDETEDMCARYEYETNKTMDCGRVRSKNQVIYENGNKEAMVGTAPWLVGIYKLINYNYHWKCGGSIIAPNLVVSAATCFWEEGMLSKTISINDDRYKINVGKFNRNYTFIENEFTKIMSVKKIYLSEGYKGENGVPKEDSIAVILLADKVTFGNGLERVCIDWRSKYNVLNEEQGKVFVWNTRALMEERKYDLLLEKNYSYINSSMCQQSIPPRFIQYVTYASFCARSQSGDSDILIEGTGISFLHSNSYFLTGVNIHSLNLESSTKITGFTDIKYHVQWIRGLLNKHDVTDNSCVLPISEGVVYSYEGSNKILPHGILINPHATIIKYCYDEYKNTYYAGHWICQENGEWNITSDQLCSRMCPPLESDRLDIICIHNKKYVNCSNSSIPGTIATASCKPAYYTAPNDRSVTPLESRCLTDGRWNQGLSKCTPYCGRVHINQNFLMNNTHYVREAPWNVGVFRFNRKKLNYDLKCRGSIISPNLVLSATPCFGEEGMVSDTIYDKNGSYKIAVGQFDRNLSFIDNKFNKIFDVDRIHIKKSDNTLTWFNIEGIAIIVLQKTVSFSRHVAPICLDWDGKYKLANGDNGEVVGWGITTTGIQIPNILLSASVLDYNSWKNLFKKACRQYSIDNQFCVSFALDQEVDIGDIGASLSFSRSGYHYLTGVKIIKYQDSKNNDLSNGLSFVAVKHHMQWIREKFMRYNQV